MPTKIAWVKNPDNTTQGETLNVSTGCLRTSPGCQGCYAERLASTRLKHLTAYKGLTRDGRWTGEVRWHPEKLAEPLKRRKPAGWFINDMSDLFWLPDKQLAAVFGMMAATPQHRYYLLTKQAARMEEWFGWFKSRLRGRAGSPLGELSDLMDGVLGEERAEPFCAAMFHNAATVNALPDTPLPNVYLGVTVEDQAHGLPRLDHLRRCPAAVRFVSMEPLLEDPGAVDLRGISWVIVGGESGPKARPFDLAWARSIVAQCRAAGVPVFVKQLGARPTLHGYSRREGDYDLDLERIHHPAGADPAEWPEDLRVRQMPEADRG